MHPAYAGFVRQQPMSKDCCISISSWTDRPIAEVLGGTRLRRERRIQPSRAGSDEHLQQLRSANLVETLSSVGRTKPFVAVSFFQFKHPLIAKSLRISSAEMQAEEDADDAEVVTEIYLVRHAQSSMNVKPELLGGRSPWAVLTPWGQRQAQALGQSLRNAGVRFDAVFASPLERAKQTAITMCQELNYPAEQIQFSEALEEVAQGEWEGRLRKEVYTPQVREVISSMQMDFHAPGGESPRQAEFRMVEFLTNVILPRADTEARRAHGARNDTIGRQEHDEVQVLPAEVVSTGVENASHNEDCVANGDRLVEVPGHHVPSSLDDLMPFSVAMEAELLRTTDRPTRRPPFCGAVVTHGFAMKCLLRGLLGSDPQMTRRVTIDNASVTVLRHSTITGWQIQRVNDTSHLRSLKGARV